MDFDTREASFSDGQTEQGPDTTVETSPVTAEPGEAEQTELDVPSTEGTDSDQ